MTHATPPGPERSWIARAAPSWTFAGHRAPNGSALVASLLGFASGVFLSFPGGSTVALGLLLAIPCLLAARAGRRRAEEHPWIGGRRLAASGPLMVAAGVVLALTWFLIGA